MLQDDPYFEDLTQSDVDTENWVRPIVVLFLCAIVLAGIAVIIFL